MRKLIIGLFANLAFSVAIPAVSGAAPPATERKFGVGDLVYSKELKEPLPNVWGSADIFGRKRTKGLIEVRYIGIASPGHAIFYRRDISVMTNETTMNRSQHFSAVATGSGSTSVVTGSISADAKIETLPPDTVEIIVDMDTDPSLLINGTEILVLEATPSKVRVKISEQSR